MRSSTRRLIRNAASREETSVRVSRSSASRSSVTSRRGSGFCSTSQRSVLHLSAAWRDSSGRSSRPGRSGAPRGGDRRRRGERLPTAPPRSTSPESPSARASRRVAALEATEDRALARELLERGERPLGDGSSPIAAWVSARSQVARRGHASSATVARERGDARVLVLRRAVEPCRVDGAVRTATWDLAVDGERATSRTAAGSTCRLPASPIFMHQVFSPPVQSAGPVQSCRPSGGGFPAPVFFPQPTSARFREYQEHRAVHPGSVSNEREARPCQQRPLCEISRRCPR